MRSNTLQWASRMKAVVHPPSHQTGTTNFHFQWCFCEDFNSPSVPHLRKIMWPNGHLETTQSFKGFSRTCCLTKFGFTVKYNRKQERHRNNKQRKLQSFEQFHKELSHSESCPWCRWNINEFELPSFSLFYCHSLALLLRPHPSRDLQEVCLHQLASHSSQGKAVDTYRHFRVQK